MNSIKATGLMWLFVCVHFSIQAQFTLAPDLSKSYAIESNYHLVFTNLDKHFEASIPQEFEEYDSINVVYHDTVTIDNQLSMRMKLHVINSKDQHYLWQQVAVPLKYTEPEKEVITIAEEILAMEDTPPTNAKYVQIGAFSHEDGANELSQKAVLFKTKIIYANSMWKVVIPYTVGLYDEVKKYHDDAFITFY